MGLEVILMRNTLATVIVLYQMKLVETPNYQLLKQQLERDELTLIVYDNSPIAQEDVLLENENVIYVHDKSNSGLAKAYNTALRYCQENQIDLLLLLDQDTQLPKMYFEVLLTKELNEDVAVYVPLAMARQQQISPVFSHQYIRGASQKVAPGIYEAALMAINSGTVLTLATMNWLSEFNLAFPLDFLDHWFFWQLHQAKKKVEVLNIPIQQELSVLHYSSISLKRYDSIIRAESLFYQKYDKNKCSAHKRHLFLRAMKQFLLVKNRKIWRRTMKECFSLMKGK
jgi:glycosyltransferase involved in cell wall biosynthesis